MSGYESSAVYHSHSPARGGAVYPASRCAGSSDECSYANDGVEAADDLEMGVSGRAEIHWSRLT